jgi:hypothetical protein
MRIDAFLQESPMFAVNRAARRFESLATQALASDGLNFLEGLTLTAIVLRGSAAGQAIATGGGLRNDAGQCEPLRLIAGSHGPVAEKD